MLTPISELMHHAREKRYAVGYFESWNLESLQGVLDAAEHARAPVIIGFNGEFLSEPERSAPERLELWGALGRAAAENADVPCGFIFNECPRDEWTCRAVTSGFNLVMPADAAAPPREYSQRTASIAQYAHQHGVAVEAELGELPCGASGEIWENGAMTTPEEAARFVAETGVDLLAVSVGNVHIRVAGRGELDLERLAAIRERVEIPLVLHGGTGIGAQSLRDAIEIGVAKVNFGTNLKQAYLEAVRAALATENLNPHQLLGMGGCEDVMNAGRHAVREAVLERMRVLACCGRA